LMGTGKKCLALHALWSPSCCNISISLIEVFGAMGGSQQSYVR
jgi:hypothetical protein